MWTILIWLIFGWKPLLNKNWSIKGHVSPNEVKRKKANDVKQQKKHNVNFNDEIEIKIENQPSIENNEWERSCSPKRKSMKRSGPSLEELLEASSWQAVNGSSPSTIFQSPVLDKRQLVDGDDGCVPLKIAFEEEIIISVDNEDSYAGFTFDDIDDRLNSSIGDTVDGNPIREAKIVRQESEKRTNVKLLPRQLKVNDVDPPPPHAEGNTKMTITVSPKIKYNFLLKESEDMPLTSTPTKRDHRKRPNSVNNSEPTYRSAVQIQPKSPYGSMEKLADIDVTLDLDILPPDSVGLRLQDGGSVEKNGEVASLLGDLPPPLEDQSLLAEDVLLLAEVAPLPAEDESFLAEDVSLLAEDVSLLGDDVSLLAEVASLHVEDASLHAENKSYLDMKSNSSETKNLVTIPDNAGIKSNMAETNDNISSVISVNDNTSTNDISDEASHDSYISTNHISAEALHDSYISTNHISDEVSQDSYKPIKLIVSHRSRCDSWDALDNEILNEDKNSCKQIRTNAKQIRTSKLSKQRTPNSVSELLDNRSGPLTSNGSNINSIIDGSREYPMDASSSRGNLRQASSSQSACNAPGKLTAESSDVFYTKMTFNSPPAVYTEFDNVMQKRKRHTDVMHSAGALLGAFGHREEKILGHKLKRSTFLWKKLEHAVKSKKFLTWDQ